MAEYIDKSEIYRRFFDGGNGIAHIHASDIDVIPAVDVAPVVHGYWIEHIDSYENYCECSVCHYSPDSPLDETPYCPHCGAKMDLKNEMEEK